MFEKSESDNTLAVVYSVWIPSYELGYIGGGLGYCTVADLDTC